jgi:hypothetical protein
MIQRFLLAVLLMAQFSGPAPYPPSGTPFPIQHRAVQEDYISHQKGDHWEDACCAREALEDIHAKRWTCENKDWVLMESVNGQHYFCLEVTER